MADRAARVRGTALGLALVVPLVVGAAARGSPEQEPQAVVGKLVSHAVSKGYNMKWFWFILKLELSIIAVRTAMIVIR